MRRQRILSQKRPPQAEKPAIGLLYGLVPKMRIREDMVFSTFFYRNLRKGMIKTRSTP